MSRLITAGSPRQASVTLSLNTSTMYFGFSLGSTLGAAILDTGNIWAIGFLAGVSVAIALYLNTRFLRKHAYIQNSGLWVARY